MANYIVVSPSQSTSGGNSGDLYYVNSAAVSGATIVGGTGADTIEMLEGGVAGSAASLDLKGGADTYEFSAITLSSTVGAGAGGDTVTFSGANTISTFNLGAGSDRLEISGGILTVLGGSTIAGGAGGDIISGNGGGQNAVFSGASVLMGAGADTITLSATLNSATFVGGGGADDFELDGNAVDTTVKGGAGGDTIGLTGNFDSSTISLSDGSDLLTLVGDVSDTGAILGGAGADKLNFSATTFTTVSGFTVGGGAGADTISFNGVVASAGAGLDVIGGGGNDSISFATNDYFVATVSAGAVGFSAGAGFASIHGGAGADSITFTGGVDGSAGFAGVLTWDAVSESTLTTQDVITFNKSAGEAAGLLMDFGGSVSTGVGVSLTNSKNGVSTNAGGFLISAGSNSSVSDRASALDVLLSTGQMGVFKDVSGSAAYIFVQGGTTDLVAKFDIAGASAGTVTLSATGDASEFKIEFDTQG
jgi:hypothetical protein